ncbi:MAG: S-layer homology domain-containing protein [Evtepia sp.]|uniref:S-layer homology domain-containing protein n=1 Tax=Evtepia sp. TaxID=2773933 RepID=UPI002A75A87E|nr:S-layer homology domain-containing protein [Evtepia sp.]MDY3014214.1 S-layer homology domain-containing protein [Evtepia sp.]
MKTILRKVGSLLLSAAMLASLAVNAAAVEAPGPEVRESRAGHAAAEQAAPPTQVTATYHKKYIEASHVYLNFGQDEATKAWLESLSQVTVQGVTYSKQHTIVSQKRAWTVDKDMEAHDLPKVLKITESFTPPAVVVLSAEGYQDLTLTLTRSGSGSDASYTGEIQRDGARETDPQPEKTISLDQIQVTDDGGIFPAYHWYIGFTQAEGYVSAITNVEVNGEPWEKRDFAPSAGGAYAAETGENRLVFSINSFSSGAPAALKSGDVIKLTATGYKDLEFKFMLDKNGKNPTVEANDGQGDRYDLHVKLKGSFEAAIVGQKDYDGVSGATGSVSTNKNSDVTVYGALVEKGTEPQENDWKELESGASDITIDGSKCTVSIVPDTEKGTPANHESGMRGVHLTISSALTLSGTPKDPGHYLVSMTVADAQGRTATSNALPFRVYTGEETLADQLKLENLRQTQDGKHMWDIMEPWAIKHFGSNVVEEENSVRVPATLKAWYGSHTSGTYGYLGYDIPWEEVLADNIPQTLHIPNGCDLTLVNMKILSSVRIVVENGGKLTLRDSVVQGIIDVADGGTFSMNYNGFGKGTFLTGASLCGQLRLQDGAILENAAIYSHTNYLANGDLTDRTSNQPVVVANGNVTVRGKVFIQGDEAGDGVLGQAGLLVKKGTLTVEEGATLVVYGGDAKVQPATGGTAIQLDEGTITGEGTVVAIGGRPLFGNGGTGVTGQGTISTAQAFLQGATAFSSGSQAGKALNGEISVTSPRRHVADGTMAGTTADDPLADLYWKSGIEPTPPLSAFSIPALFTITATAGEGGSISPVGEVKVEDGKDQTFTIQPNSGYHVKDVTVDGKSVGAVSSYTFEKVTGDHTIKAVFAKDDPTTRYRIEASAGPGGTISPEGIVRISQGGSQHFTITPNEGYKILDVVVDGKSVGPVDKYTFQNVRAWHTIEVTFTRQPASPGDTGVSNWLDTKNHMAYLNGYPGGVFAPQQNMTRAEAAQMFCNLLLEKNVPITVSFTDVNDNAWYAKAVNTLASLGMIQGVEGNRFEPDRAITRAEFTAIAMRFTNGGTKGDNIFSDVHPGQWFYDAVVGSIQYGWINGYEDDTFRPNNTITRAEVAAITNRMLDREADRGYVDAHADELRLFSDVDKGHWAYYTIVEASHAH